MADPRSQPWAVLGLDPSWFPELSGSSSLASSASSASADDATRSALLRRAYRRALLQHHPDKQVSGSKSGRTAYKYTVDEIRSAYASLGGGGGQSAAAKAVLGGLATGSTATGLEIVDLDELPFDEVGDGDEPVQTWYRSCRCGNARGFTFSEHDLEEELDAEAMETLAGGAGSSRSEPAVGELMVGCQDCSLWLCVHFAAAPDDEDLDDDDEGDE
ncbi:hypothetical protein F503_04792 [Ophiostoma piceae UAMH 11346]|uniref:DPH-type MB domain-containing protein n=1 Tax=Ophiostoma piceae (strain UAMH 11346) TaxID=1262450 RepID=S3BRN3_OPHP1|nr:hypothetical protein F503_04792 [Ophiostoma piceae UAMH 11346]